MRFSDQLEAKFENLLAHSSGKRAVVLPMALFVRDEVGLITPEIVAELADRLGMTESQVKEELGRYSMLKSPRARKQPIPFPSRPAEAPAGMLRRAA